MDETGLLAEVVRRIRAKPTPSGIAAKIVAIDGPGGAGKTTFARSLASELGGAPIIQTDDFAGWDNPLDWWPDLIEKALEPLAAGKAARYEPTTWGGPDREPVVIEPTELLILEGVSASRRAFRPYLAYSIWIDAPRDVRLGRGLERDRQVRLSLGLEPNPEQALASWRRWMAEEDDYIARERSQEHADQIVPR